MGPTRRKPKASKSSGSKKELEKKPKKEYPRFLSGERFQLYSFASELPKPKPKPRHVTRSIAAEIEAERREGEIVYVRVPKMWDRNLKTPEPEPEPEPITRQPKPDPMTIKPNPVDEPPITIKEEAIFDESEIPDIGIDILMPPGYSGNDIKGEGDINQLKQEIMVDEAILKWVYDE